MSKCIKIAPEVTEAASNGRTRTKTLEDNDQVLVRMV